MLNITHYQRNATQNHNEVPISCQSEWLPSQTLQTINGGEGECCWRECKLVQPLWRTVWRFLESESEVTQSCPTLCDPIDCSLPSSSVHGILQARIVDWVAISFSRGSSRHREWTRVSHIGGRRFNFWATREPYTLFSLKKSEVTQSCLTLCDPMDCSLPGSSVHGIFQARVLDWVAISFSRGSSWPRDWTGFYLHSRQTLYCLATMRNPQIQTKRTAWELN